jgi:hypothetical protein
MTEEQITQQAINEFDARQAAMRVYDAVMAAEAAATAFPENFARLREPAAAGARGRPTGSWPVPQPPPIQPWPVRWGG